MDSVQEMVWFQVYERSNTTGTEQAESKSSGTFCYRYLPGLAEASDQFHIPSDMGSWKWQELVNYWPSMDTGQHLMGDAIN